MKIFLFLTTAKKPLSLSFFFFFFFCFLISLDHFNDGHRAITPKKRVAVIIYKKKKKMKKKIFKNTKMNCASCELRKINVLEKTKQFSTEVS